MSEGLVCNTWSPVTLKSLELRVAVKTASGEERVVGQAASWLCHRVLEGAVTHGRAGLGACQTPRYDKTWVKEQQQPVEKEVQAAIKDGWAR